MLVLLGHAQNQLLEHIQASLPVHLPAQQAQNMHVHQDHAHNQVAEHMILRQIVSHHVQVHHQMQLSEHTTPIGLIIAKLHTHMILLTLHLLWTKLTIFTMDFHTFAHHPVGRVLLTG